jgi:hypothetical protein
MKRNTVRDLGEQPLARLMREHNLNPHDLVAASTEQLTHKMVSRAVKGRRLTPQVQAKIMRALNSAARQAYSVKDLFNY